MHTISSAKEAQFRNIVSSTFRPKCEPLIQVVNEKYDETLDWGAADVVSVTFEKSIDPIGRELPMMKMTWEEILTDKLDPEQTPVKYKNLSAYLPVSFSWRQYLDFANTDYAEIYYPNLYLSGKPEVKDNVVVWSAFGILEFMQNSVNRIFEFDRSHGTYPKRKYVLEGLALSARAPYSQKPELFIAMSEWAKQLRWSFGGLYCPEEIKGTIYDGTVASLIKDTISLGNCYLDYGNVNIGVFRAFSNFEETGFYFPLELQYSNPQITNGNNISKYTSYQYSLSTERIPVFIYPQRIIFKTPEEDSTKVLAFKEYNFDGYGKAAKIVLLPVDDTSCIGLSFSLDEKKYIQKISEGNALTNDRLFLFSNAWDKDPAEYGITITGTPHYGDAFVTMLQDILSEGNRTIIYSVHEKPTTDAGWAALEREVENETVLVYKKSENGIEESEILTNTADGYIGSASGLEFIENNPLNEFHIEEKSERIEMLRKYFNSECSSMVAEIAPNVALDTGDLVSVETNLYSGNDRIIKKGVVIGIKIVYNGAIKQTLDIHEVQDEEE